MSDYNPKNDTADYLLFEYPLKENIRGFLRLESLFTQFERNQQSQTTDCHLHALKILFEILEILERGDTRSELTKELSRLCELFSQLMQNPDVDPGKLENFLIQIKQLHKWVLDYSGKFGDKLRKDPFIESVKHRTSIPGGACHFDCPELYLFLEQPAVQRQSQLKLWLENIKGVKTSIEVILRIIRESGKWQSEQAPMGSFMIDTSSHPLQLLRVKVERNSQIFPEFSCGKHRSNIHFMRFNEHSRKITLQKPITFQLSLCQ